MIDSIDPMGQQWRNLTVVSRGGGLGVYTERMALPSKTATVVLNGG